MGTKLRVIKDMAVTCAVFVLDRGHLLLRLSPGAIAQ